MNNAAKLKIFDKLKKGGTVKIKFDFDSLKGKEETFKVLDKKLVGKGQSYEEEQITMTMVGVKKVGGYALHNRGGNVRFVIGEYPAEIVNMKEEVELEEASGDKEAYKKFFNAAMKKFKINSPADLKGDDKKKFYDYIDKGWEGDNEKAEAAMSQVREFKIQSMKAALAQVWGMEEGKNPFKTKNDKKDDDDEKNGNTMTGKKKATIDINPNQSYR